MLCIADFLGYLTKSAVLEYKTKSYIHFGCGPVRVSRYPHLFDNRKELTLWAGQLAVPTCDLEAYSRHPVEVQPNNG